MHHYHSFIKIANDIPVNKLNKFNNNIKKDVPYEIYTEKSENENPKINVIYIFDTLLNQWYLYKNYIISSIGEFVVL